MKSFFYVLITALLCYSCGNNESDDTTSDDELIIEVIDTPGNDEGLYFPPSDSDAWETDTLQNLNWNEAAAEDLTTFLSERDTRGFILLKDGKIVIEKYWGNDILDTNAFTKDTNWYWASAGKTLTAFLVGLAQEKELLNINDKTSDYLGENWTSLTKEKEDLITLKNQLTMTTGLDYNVPNINCTTSDCLLYKTDAGNQWFYHNAPYTLLGDVVSNAAEQSYNMFTNENIASKIGLQGSWIPNGDFNLFWSTPRSAARFGLLLLNKGKWNDTQIMKDQEYYNAMVSSSQSLNPSYGYLTWLNGKSSTVFPGLETSFNVPLSEDAPNDLFAAIGRNGQIIDVVPSKNIVVIRMGEAPDDSLVPVTFHNQMWEKINAVIE